MFLDPDPDSFFSSAGPGSGSGSGSVSKLDGYLSLFSSSIASFSPKTKFFQVFFFAHFYGETKPFID